MRNEKAYGFSTYRWIVVSEWARDKTNRSYFIKARTIKSVRYLLWTNAIYALGSATTVSSICISMWISIWLSFHVLNNPELCNCHGTALTHTLVIYKDLHCHLFSYSLKTDNSHKSCCIRWYSRYFWNILYLRKHTCWNYLSDLRYKNDNK